MTINATTIAELRNAVKKMKNKVVQARDLQFNRAAIEQNLADILVFPAILNGQDKIKYLDSGLNLIAANIASKNKVIIAIDFSALRQLDSTNFGYSLAILRQNMKICNKAKVPLGYTNSRTGEGAKAFLRLLGASTNQASQAISF